MLLLALLLCAPLKAQPAPDPDPATDAADATISPPTLVEFVDAPYPPAARMQGLEADVLLRIAIAADGSVSGATVIEPVGNGFDEAALEAARSLRFQPALAGTEPIAVLIEFTYGFRLGEDAAPVPVNLEIDLMDRATRKALDGLRVQVIASDGTTFDAISDEAGGVRLRGVPDGMATVVVALGTHELKRQGVELMAGEVSSLRLFLHDDVLADDELVVLGARETPDITRRTITVEEIKRVPGTFGDPVRVIQNLPGAARAPFGTGLLIIRGANPGDSNVYVDGVEVPIIYHLGGYRSVINADLIESVDYLPGGYGVRYGQATGGVIDVRTRDDRPSQPQLTWKSDLLDSGAFYRMPLGENGAVAMAARRSYIDVFIPFFAGDTGFFIKPRWFDYQARLWRDDGTDLFSLFVFGFNDLLFISTPDDFAQGTDPDTQGDLSASYGTHRIVGRWRHRFSDQLELVVQPFVGMDSVDLGLGTSLAISQTFTNAGLRASMPWTPSDAFTLTPGIDAQMARFEVGLTLPFQIDSGTDPLAEREPFTTTIDGWGFIPDPYVDAQIRPLPDRDRLMLNPGLRWSSLLLPDQGAMMALDPRFAFRLRTHPGGYLKGGTGLYQQPPDGQEFGLEDELTLRFERAWASELGFQQALGNRVLLEITAYNKELDRLVVSNPDFRDFDTDPLYKNLGIGRIRGMEFMARPQPVGKFFGWLSYTLSQSERNDLPGTADGGWYRFDFDQTHILTVVAGYDLPRDWGLSSRLQYVTGNPYTPYAGGIYDLDQDSFTPYQTAPRNSERLSPYLALDMRVDKTWVFKGWTLEGYADLLNVIRGENPEQLQYNYDYTESTVVRGLPFIPAIGFQADIFF